MVFIELRQIYFTVRTLILITVWTVFNLMWIFLHPSVYILNLKVKKKPFTQKKWKTRIC